MALILSQLIVSKQIDPMDSPLEEIHDLPLDTHAGEQGSITWARKRHCFHAACAPPPYRGTRIQYKRRSSVFRSRWMSR